MGVRGWCANLIEMTKKLSAVLSTDRVVRLHRAWHGAGHEDVELAKGIVGSSHSRECGKRALWTRMARPVELDSWPNREYNQRVGMSVANGTCVSLVEVGLRVLPIKTLP